MNWTPIHEFVRQPPVEQWLSPAPKNVIEYRRKMMAMFTALCILLTVAMVFFLNFYTFFPGVLAGIAMYILGGDNYRILRSYKYVNTEGLKEIEQVDPLEVQEVLKDLMKSQGFLVHGQVLAARQKHLFKEEEDLKQRWK